MVIGIDIGGTKIRIASSSRGVNLGRTVYTHTPDNYPEALHLISQTVATLAGRYEIEAIGIVSPGPFNRKSGRILNPSHLPWHNVPIGQQLTQAFHCPVFLDHDTALAGIIEARYGSGRGVRHVLYITISTGIGMAQIVDGMPLPGDYNAEGGRQLIQQTVHDRLISFEDLASGAAIYRDFGKIAADIHNKRNWDEISRRLAIGIYNAIVITNPEIVVLGGGVSVHFHRFIQPLRKHLAAMPHLCPLPPIRQARYVEVAPLIGAIYLARSHIS